MTVTRREAMKRGGKAVVAAALLPVIPAMALGTSNNDAALIYMGKEVFRLIDEINAGLHSPDGNVPDEVWDRRCDLVDAIADTAAHGLEGVAVKLRMAAYQIGIANNEYTTESECVLSALETVERLAGRVS